MSESRPRDTNNVYEVIILTKIVFQYCNIHKVHVIVNAIFNLRCRSSCICVSGNDSTLKTLQCYQCNHTCCYSQHSEGVSSSLGVEFCPGVRCLQ